MHHVLESIYSLARRSGSYDLIFCRVSASVKVFALHYNWCMVLESCSAMISTPMAPVRKQGPNVGHGNTTAFVPNAIYDFNCTRIFFTYVEIRRHSKDFFGYNENICTMIRIEGFITKIY